jgi:hypothetical protein
VRILLFSPLVAGTVLIKWHPPDRLNFKLNLACAMDLENSQMGLGVIIRDSMGLVGAARCSRMNGVGHGLAAHANAVLNALEFAFAVGFRRLEVELGHKELLGLITKIATSPCLSSIGVVVDDICGWVHMFQFLSFSFIKNDCNKAAQALATEAASSSFEHVWLEDYPACITTIV